MIRYIHVGPHMQTLADYRTSSLAVRCDAVIKSYKIFPDRRWSSGDNIEHAVRPQGAR